MNIQKGFVPLLLTLVLFPSCDNTEKSIHIKEIDIASAVGNLEVVELSHFSNEIEYIALETKEEAIIGDYFQYTVDDNNIIFSDQELSMLLYDRTGNYKRKFGSKGRGPEEYQTLDNLSISGNQVCLSSGRDLFIFSRRGEFQRKHPGVLSPQKEIQLDNITIIDDTLIFGHIPNNDGQSPYKGMLINMEGKVKEAYANYDIIESAGSRINGGSTQVYSFEESIHFKEQFTDTLFFIDKKYKLIPKFSFRMGNLKMPQSVRRDFFEYFKKMNDYYAVENILESPQYLFIDLNFGSHFPLFNSIGTDPNQELARKTISTPHCLGIYNKETAELMFCRPNPTTNPLSISGIHNDLDGGPSFFPEKMINDTTMIMVVSPLNLIEYVNSQDFIDSAPKYPEKKEELRKFVGRLSEDSNPVLILLTLK